MRVAIRWSVAIIGTVASFALVTWISTLAGLDEGWALGLAALAAALVLAALQTWATTHRHSTGHPDAERVARPSHHVRRSCAAARPPK